MPHTAEDWSWGKSTTIFELYKGFSELAARLWSIVTFDRRGNVLFMDGFEGGLTKWALTSVFPAPAIHLTGDAARNGALSCCLTTRAVLADASYIEHYQVYRAATKFGVEFSFNPDADNPRVFLQLELYDGTWHTWAGLRYNFLTDVLEYRSGPAAWTQVVAGLDLWETGDVFHTMKLVFDSATRQYVRGIVNDVTYDLSAYPLDAVLSGEAPRLRVVIGEENPAAAVCVTYIDDVIITQNED